MVRTLGIDEEMLVKALKLLVREKISDHEEDESVKLENIEGEINEKDSSYVTAEVGEDEFDKSNVSIKNKESKNVNNFVLKRIVGDGKCGISSISNIIKWHNKNVGIKEKIEEKEVLKALYRGFEKKANKIQGVENLEWRKKRNNIKNIKDYGQFLKKILNSDFIDEDEFLIDVELDLIATEFKINVVVIHKDIKNDIPKHYFHGNEDDMVYFIYHAGMHFDVMLLSEGSVYIEKELIRNGKLTFM